MKPLKKIVYLSLLMLSLLCSSKWMLAQQLSRQFVGSDGEYLQHPTEGNLHFSIGEPIVEWLDQDSIQLSQGFQQYDIEAYNYPNDFSLFNLYPNPNNGSFILVIGVSNRADVDLEAYNVLGQLVHRQTHPNLLNGRNFIQVKLPDESSGVYFVSFIVNGNRLQAEQFDDGPLSDKPLKYYQYTKFVVLP